MKFVLFQVKYNLTGSLKLSLNKTELNMKKIQDNRSFRLAIRFGFIGVGVKLESYV